MGWTRKELPNLTTKRRYLEIRNTHLGRFIHPRTVLDLLFWSLQGDSPVSDRLEGTSNYNYRVVKEVCSFEF